MKQAGKTQESAQAGSWLTVVTMVNECGMAFGRAGMALVQDPAKAKQCLIARSSWDIKLKPLKARLSFTNNIGTQTQKAMPMTRRASHGHKELQLLISPVGSTGVSD